MKGLKSAALLSDRGERKENICRGCGNYLRKDADNATYIKLSVSGDMVVSVGT